MLTKLRLLIEEFNATGIRYCHWKSNLALAQSLAGQTDVDLLIHRRDAGLFRAILSQHGFRPAATPKVESFPSVEHYFALDEESGVLIHVHAYFRVITGESLTKNYHFPIEELLLQNTRNVDAIPVPAKSAELLVFTVRMMLKHSSLVELIMVGRYWKEVKREIQWLLEDDPLEERPLEERPLAETLNAVYCWLPSLDTALFAECVEAIKAPAPLMRRVMLGRKVRAQLRPYRRHSAVRNWLGGLKKFTIMAFQRLTGSKLAMVPQSGGAVIAFVGSEATGKTTLLAEMKGWLGKHFTVEQVHVGKPKSTLLTAIPNLLVPTLRSILPSARSTHVETQYVPREEAKETRPDFPLLFGIRSVLLAYDRRALLTRVFGRAANGTIVLCDRYPSLLSGTPDSPQLAHIPVSADGSSSSLRRRLARLEARLYRQMPPPDLVVNLYAPLEVVISRNASRGKREPEDYVRRRHARSANVEFGTTPVQRINTDQPFDQTVLEVKKAIWNAL